MNTTTEFTDPYPFEDFAPTLSQCFVLVAVGYLLSRFEILTSSDVKGVTALATYFAMPGIICVSLMDADFSDFRWELLLGIFLGKLCTFVAVAGFWILLKGNVGVAGVVALFCTQSNDLPVGNPLMSSLYKNYRPQMMKYLFLIPATTVIFFVPVSNIMMSVHRERQKRAAGDPSSFGYVRKEDILQQIRGIATNPVVIATMCGLTLNVALNEGAPEALHQPIKVAAATIPGIALVMLGFSFVRKEKYFLSSAVVPATALFVLKMIITPIMFHAIVKGITEESTSSKLLSDFALLYGIVSPATAVFVSGREFRKALAAMSVALILSSFTCFPVSYVVARLTIAPVHKLSSYVPILKIILFWSACISICCGVIAGILILLKNRWQQISSYILCLLFSQIITSSGLILWSTGERQLWVTYCVMVLYYGGEISVYLWTGILGIVLAFKHKSWMLTKRGFFIILCMALSVSATITIVMCLLISYNTIQTVYVIERARSNFELLQLIMTSILLFVSLTIVAACLTHHFKNHETVESKITEASAYDNTVFYVEDIIQDIIQTENSKELSSVEKVSEKTEGKTKANVYCQEILKDKSFTNSPLLEEREWTFRLSSLLILLSLTMLVRFIVNLFKLFHSTALEVIIPMELVQSALFTGQGIFVLLTFGIDIRTVIISLKKWFRKTLRRDNIVAYSNESDTRDVGQIKDFCNHFRKFYYNRCFADIAKERRWKDIVYKDSFWGHQLVDWLITEGLCLDDVDAEGYGQKLLEGRVIQHVSQKHHFYDAPYLYQFFK